MDGSILNLTVLALAAAAAGGFVVWVGARRMQGSNAPITSLPKVDVPAVQPTPEQSRLEGRNQILESSHVILQQDLIEARAKILHFNADLAREAALRAHLEVALGKSHEDLESLRSQLESAKQAESRVQSLMHQSQEENASLKRRVAELEQVLEESRNKTLSPGTISSVSIVSEPAPGRINGFHPKPSVIENGNGMHPAEPAPAPVVAAASKLPIAAPTVLASKPPKWAIELENFRRRTTEKPAKKPRGRH